MKNKFTLMVAICALMASPMFAQDSEHKMTPEEASWMEYMAVGEIHKMMASWDGEWTENITMWMDPDAPPAMYESACVNRMLMGGRYQESVHTGSFDEMPFQGISITGYDNALQKFVSTWIDNMGTGIMNMEGAWDANTKTITFYGDAVDPMTKSKMEVKETFEIVDDNTQKMVMYKIEDDKEIKTMEITFTRK